PAARRRRHPGHSPDVAVRSVDISGARDRALQGNLERQREKLASQNKLLVRDRLAALLDEGSWVEDALLANAMAGDLPADGVVTMVEGNASMYLGSPRMAEMVIGERTTLEEMGGARMHATVSGSGDNLATDDEDAIAQARRYFSYMPQRWREEADAIEPGKPATSL